MSSQVGLLVGLDFETPRVSRVGHKEMSLQFSEGAGDGTRRRAPNSVMSINRVQEACTSSTEAEVVCEDGARSQRRGPRQRRSTKAT